ncbi:carbohydrate porin [Cyanobium sp. Alchichica 3B3-8F6]|uniref:iron uptake porin n=1 Tax=Cyanobium sp. Alchichica 3B3-8F6 TaxID=2823696 RepID=UPI0020CF0890|nr:iron uptake porin [Cyanobium sp. Alchichica 3B3-8F6]MCP9883053.1 carbohydrate porin [Cyanobium sp. Alchichica 3B3-8F6]
MNLSKKLLLALAGTSLAAPMAASAQELASLSGAAAINEYMQQQDVDRFRAWESKNQVTSVNQFSDVQPTDWAYQALSNLVEKYGCVAGYPNGTYKGGNAMTRFEAAALLNACLDRVTEVTDELQRLMDEFKTELAALTGRVDGLEKKVGKLEAQQFSTTTKLRGEASFIIGGLPNNNATTTDGARRNKTTFNYDYRLTFDTSYTGKDLLRGRLRSGNFTAPFGSSSNIFNLDKATNTNKDVVIDRLYYTFPVGNEVKLTAGALVRNTELLSFRPSVYNSGLLDFFGLSGATGTYNKATGAGFGFQWKQKVKKGDPYATFDASYIAANGSNDSSIGAFTEDSGISVLTQLGFRGQNWGTAIAYRYGGAGSQVGRDGNMASALSTLSTTTGQTSSSVSIGAFWQPTDASWMPSISAGYGFSDVSGTVSSSIPNQGNIQSWMVGFQWKDVFQKGNNAGFAFGQAPFASNATAERSSESFLWEFFYKYQVTDKISITPGIFYAPSYQAAGGDSTWGGVIQTTFRF